MSKHSAQQNYNQFMDWVRNIKIPVPKVKLDENGEVITTQRAR
jgi:hypothetical protein